MQRRRHRQYGLSNANQVLLAVVVAAMLFLALLRRNWLNLDAASDASVKGGLWGIYVASGPGTTSTSWSAFCSGNRTLSMPGGEPQPLTDGETHMLCTRLSSGALVPEVARGAIAAAIGLSALSVVAAIYLHFGAPSREQVFWVGTVPGLALIAAAVLGSVALIVWQARYRPFDNGDCFSILVAATVIAYAVAISMLVRWRWPGVCAVPNEQQARTNTRGDEDVLRVFRQRARRHRQRSAREDEAPPAAESPPWRSTRGPTAFHQLA